MKLGGLLYLVHSIHNDLTNRYKFFYIFLLYHFIDLAFRTFQNRIQIFFAAIADIGNLFIGTDQASEGCFLRYNSCVVFNICRSRNRCDQVRQEIQTADLRWNILFGSQAILQCYEVDRLSLIVQFHNGIKHNAILPVIKIIAGYLFCCRCYGLRINKHRSNH